MSNQWSRFGIACKLLLFWCLFVGVDVLWGGTAMPLKPDGSILHMQAMLPYFVKLQLADILFQDDVFPGIALICVNGITNITAALLLFQKTGRRHWGYDLWNHADAVNLHTVLYVPIQ